MKLTGHQIIGLDTSAEGTSTFQAANPATLEKLLPAFNEATEKEVDRAVRKAREAFEVYRLSTGEERAVFLETIADEIQNLGDDLLQRCMEETALPEARLTGERGRTMNQLKLFAQLIRDGSWVDARIDTAIPDREPLPKPDIRQMQIPPGPVGVFGASDFPLAFSVAGGDTASALAAGCPVVVKGHPMHPGTSEMVGTAIRTSAKKTGMPEGVFSLVQGVSVDVGMALVKHPEITAIGFTGSFKGGKALFDAANQRPTPIPVFAEMGSSNPVFVLPKALKERGDEISRGMCNSVNLGVGQFCTSPGLMVTPKSSESEELLQVMKDVVESGDNGTMLGEGIKRNYQTAVHRLESTDGVSLVATGGSADDGNQAQCKIYAAEGKTLLANRSLEEEVFGPATLQVSASGKEEMLRIAESLEGHLTATIHGTEEDLAEYGELVRILEQKAGRMIFNGFPTGVEVCHSMVHGGPFPATTAPQTTSVGTAAIKRFVRPVCYQDFPQAALTEALKDDNPLKIWRLVNGEWTRDPVS